MKIFVIYQRGTSVDTETEKFQFKEEARLLFSRKSLLAITMLGINICNNILGGGIIGNLIYKIALPAALKMSGVALGIILHSFSSGMSCIF